LRDDALNGFDRFVARGETYMNICGLPVGALRGVSGEFITPPILDELHMCRIIF